MTEPTNLSALLGDRYDDVIDKAARAHAEADDDGCFDRLDEHAALVAAEPWREYGAEDDSDAEDAAWHRAHVTDALAAVLPDLLAEAWDEGHDRGRTLSPGLAAISIALGLQADANPYRTEETR